MLLPDLGKIESFLEKKPQWYFISQRYFIPEKNQDIHVLSILCIYVKQAETSSKSRFWYSSLGIILKYTTWTCLVILFILVLGRIFPKQGTKSFIFNLFRWTGLSLVLSSSRNLSLYVTYVMITIYKAYSIVMSSLNRKF